MVCFPLVSPSIVYIVGNSCGLKSVQSMGSVHADLYSQPFKGVR